jgi:hypothetical protein
MPKNSSSSAFAFASESAPTNINSKEESKALAHPKPMSDRALPGFEMFWEAYPKKIGKVAARRAWLSAVKDDSQCAEVIAGIMDWQSTEQWQDPQFIPYPAKFLNQRRWADNPHGGQHGRALNKAERRDESSVNAVKESLRRREGNVGLLDKILPGISH